jgi:hypothetical protein
MRKKTRIVFGALLLCAAGLYFAFKSSSFDRFLVKRYFGFDLPNHTLIFERDLNLIGPDGSVGWLVALPEGAAIGLPLDYSKIEYSPDSFSKYQEVMSHFSVQLSTYKNKFEKCRMFVGGVDGNTFVCAEKTNSFLVLYRFWT